MQLSIGQVGHCSRGNDLAEQLTGSEEFAHAQRVLQKKIRVHETERRWLVLASRSFVRRAEDRGQEVGDLNSECSVEENGEEQREKGLVHHSVLTYSNLSLLK